MRKNSFVEGTVVAYISILITKIIGAIYVIPFYDIIGTDGGV
jgi:O-antigen/teichoic acid export membrane protein